MPAPSVACQCGHSLDAHTHLRKGSDCALCSQGSCPRFSPEGRARSSRLATVLSAPFRRSRAGSVSTLPHARPQRQDPQPIHPDTDTPAREA